MRTVSVILLIVLGLAARPAGADQNDAHLDPLFKHLRATDTAADAQVIEAAIWGLWLQSGSDTVDLLMQRSIAAMQTRQFGVSLALLDTIVEMAPDFAEGWNKRATVYFLMGRLEESLDDVDRTLRLEPRHFGALAGLGMINMQLGEEQAALSAYQRARAVHPHLANIGSEIKRLKKKLQGEKI